MHELSIWDRSRRQQLKARVVEVSQRVQVVVVVVASSATTGFGVLVSA